MTKNNFYLTNFNLNQNGKVLIVFDQKGSHFRKILPLSLLIIILHNQHLLLTNIDDLLRLLILIKEI